MSVRRGFTILEAAVALLIVGLTASAVLVALSAQIRGAEHANAQLTAALLAQDIGARISLTAATALSPLADSLARGRFSDPFSSYRWEAAVTPVTSEPGLIEVSVRVFGVGEVTLRSRRYVPQSRSEGL